MGLSLLRYRSWEGTPRGSWSTPWPIARTGLWMIFRRKLFWGLYALALVNFMVFFSGVYLLTQYEELAQDAIGEQRTREVQRKYGDLIRLLKDKGSLAGTPNTYANFFWYQGYIVTAVLALAGSVLIGNDYQHGSLPFYLSKPLGRWHYLLGKGLAVALFVNMMTTLPAVILFLECSLLSTEDYFGTNLPLLLGILGYGAILTVVLVLLVLATASWLRKTVPLIMVWAGLLVFGRFLANTLVDRLRLDPRWRLVDLWNNLYIVGANCLGAVPKLARWQIRRSGGVQPELWEASLVLVSVGILCLIYASRRIRAVEIVQ
jgi:ABC-type transport system involved in multi-copper enzyme maturation permease subunit